MTYPSQSGVMDAPNHLTLHLQPSFRCRPMTGFIIHAVAEMADREISVFVRAFLTVVGGNAYRFSSPFSYISDCHPHCVCVCVYVYVCAVGCSAISVFHSCAGIERPGRGALGALRMAWHAMCFLLLIMNIQLVDAGQISARCSTYGGVALELAACIHQCLVQCFRIRVTAQISLSIVIGGPQSLFSISTNKFGIVRTYPEGAIRLLNQDSFGGLMHKSFSSHFSAYSWQQSMIQGPHPFESLSSSGFLNSNKQRKSPHPSIIHHLTFAHLCRSNPFLHHRLPSTSC